MSLDELLKQFNDEKLNLVVELFRDYPGLGKRETWRLLKGQVAQNIIDEKMTFLIERGFMQVEPDDDNWHQGQSRRYFLTESLDLYIELLNRIFTKTVEFINACNMHMEASEEFNPTLYRLLESKIKNVYHLSHLMDVISTWNTGWRNNLYLMKDILMIWYGSFRDVNAIFGKIVVKNPDKIKRNHRELRKKMYKTIDNKHPEIEDTLEKIDITQLNFYRNPEHILDVIHKDIKINNDKNA